jgi:D-3-phosphoglycerate dehydrogenase
VRILIPQPLRQLDPLTELLAERHEIVGPCGVGEDELVEAVASVDALVAVAIDVTERVLGAGSRLRALGTAQVGYERIDLAAATELGLPVLCAAGQSGVTVAEFTIGLIVGLERRIVQSDRVLRSQRAWGARPYFANPGEGLGHDLPGAKLGIVGVGSIGREVARIAQVAFGMSVSGVDPYVSAAEMTAIGVRKVDDLRLLFAESDFVTLHVPLTDDTREMVGAELIGAMKPTAFLVNAARGQVVSEQALVAALREQRIAGAALDVFEREPPPATSELFELENLILTHHIAGSSYECNERRARAFARRLLATLDGEQPDGLANPQVWPAYIERCTRLNAA